MVNEREVLFSICVDESMDKNKKCCNRTDIVAFATEEQQAYSI